MRMGIEQLARERPRLRRAVSPLERLHAQGARLFGESAVGPLAVVPVENTEGAGSVAAGQRSRGVLHEGDLDGQRRPVDRLGRGPSRGTRSHGRSGRRGDFTGRRRRRRIARRRAVRLRRTRDGCRLDGCGRRGRGRHRTRDLRRETGSGVGQREPPRSHPDARGARAEREKDGDDLERHASAQGREAARPRGDVARRQLGGESEHSQRAILGAAPIPRPMAARREPIGANSIEAVT